MTSVAVTLASAATLVESTPTATTNPFDQDTFFTDWVTPGLVSGLFVALIFVVLVAVGVSWLTSIQTPRNLPSAQQHQQKKNHSAGGGKTGGPRVGWYWIPAGLGLAVIGALRLYHIERDRSADEGRRRAVEGVAVRGPWQLHVLSALPLKAMSRVFGSFNEMEIPRALRRPLLSIYAGIFGCSLEEMKDPDLSHYPNLATFFYRELRDGARPVDTRDDAAVVSPSDGKILHFGVVEQREVEQVKGLTYSLDAFFGKADDAGEEIADATLADAARSQSHNAATDDEFAVVNGIPYTLGAMIGDTSALKPAAQSLGLQLKSDERLYFCVIYLAPGDYHRFHSPANWIVETRRHFAGELYSVSPYIARTIQNLFVLNERVALLGRWRHGFMSMTAVGATNVGSVVINFDKGLRTNLREKPLGHDEFSQLGYTSLNPRLAGVPLTKGQEVGGFRLGSTVVLVFSAPATFKFCVSPNQSVKMGQALGLTEP
ncbi:phosphatidylserine decarboxylase 1 [Coemansia biformis]|uniref:Phosphatidylserine decarboxylase proenzyme 1, mitochondrial n=1 Tax=Coemansia biformis TaxID=1286918 RepID=A0A9W7Y9N3_9FUNG|nr:phosphatidylserine decarboxylase 1 [Coemansia biformis]